MLLQSDRFDFVSESIQNTTFPEETPDKRHNNKRTKRYIWGVITEKQPLPLKVVGRGCFFFKFVFVHSRPQ